MLGRTGINVMTRLMGLILAAMAVELLADGLVKLFPVLGQPRRARRMDLVDERRRQPPSTTSIVGAGTAGCLLANRLRADPPCACC